MSRIAIASLVVLTCVFGCSTSKLSRVDPEARARIGYAATARYPGNAKLATDRVQVAVLADPDDNELKLLNLSDNAITTPTLWVNGAYVRQIPTLPPRGTHTVPYETLLQAGNTANDFDRANQAVVKAELETGEGLFTVLGPAIEQ